MIGPGLAPTMNLDARLRNRVLAALPHEDLYCLRRHLKRVSLARGRVLCEADEPLRYVYFVEAGAVSLVTVFEDGTTWASLGLKGDEIVTIEGLKNIKPRERKIAKVTYGDGTVKDIPIICRIDTLDEVTYVNNGGILQTVLRDLAA